MRKKSFFRFGALMLIMSLSAAPAAQALTVQQAAELLQNSYVDEVPASVLEQPTIEKMLEALGDPYTEYFTPEGYQEFLAGMSDTELVGIGVKFSVGENGLYLEQVFDDSPAAKGGLRVGDVILAVDGKSVLGESSDTAAGWIQGQAGTSVRVTYLRNGQEKNTNLIRELVVVPATTTELIDNHIGYIRCTTFGDETVAHFQEGLQTYQNQADIWIVDLRSNLGGSTSAATDSAGLFTGAGPITYLRDGTGAYSAYYHEESTRVLGPVIVLVDAFSASASEIFASAIRDYQAGIVIGSRTYGKGVAQSVIDQTNLPEYFPDGDAIKITSYRFFSPAGNTTDQIGVVPNLLVPEPYIGDVAYLLSASEPSSSEHFLRFDFEWRWFIDLDLATRPEYRESFSVLLNAIPQGTKLWHGTDYTTAWEATAVEAIQKEYGLDKGYQNTPFPDLEESAFPKALSVLKTYGMIHGRDDGKFYPQDTLTRAELCQLLAVALNCDIPDNASPYSDVPADAWYTSAVIAMTNMGLVNGVGGGLFHPNEPVDHQQFITIMGRLAARLNMSFYESAVNIPEGTGDLVALLNYASWAKPSAWLLSSSQKGPLGNIVNLLWDNVDRIDPTAPTIRDEAAYTLYSILNYIEILLV